MKKMTPGEKKGEGNSGTLIGRFLKLGRSKSSSNFFQSSPRRHGTETEDDFVLAPVPLSSIDKMGRAPKGAKKEGNSSWIYGSNFDHKNFSLPSDQNLNFAPSPRNYGQIEPNFAHLGHYGHNEPNNVCECDEYEKFIEESGQNFKKEEKKSGKLTWRGLKEAVRRRGGGESVRVKKESRGGVMNFFQRPGTQDDYFTNNASYFFPEKKASNYYASCTDLFNRSPYGDPHVTASVRIRPKPVRPTWNFPNEFGPTPNYVQDSTPPLSQNTYSSELDLRNCVPYETWLNSPSSLQNSKSYENNLAPRAVSKTSEKMPSSENNASRTSSRSSDKSSSSQTSGARSFSQSSSFENNAPRGSGKGLEKNSSFDNSTPRPSLKNTESIYKSSSSGSKTKNTIYVSSEYENSPESKNSDLYTNGGVKRFSILNNESTSAYELNKNDEDELSLSDEEGDEKLNMRIAGQGILLANSGKNAAKNISRSNSSSSFKNGKSGQKGNHPHHLLLSSAEDKLNGVWMDTQPQKMTTNNTTENEYDSFLQDNSTTISSNDKNDKKRVSNGSEETKKTKSSKVSSGDSNAKYGALRRRRGRGAQNSKNNLIREVIYEEESEDEASELYSVKIVISGEEETNVRPILKSSKENSKNDDNNESKQGVKRVQFTPTSQIFISSPPPSSSEDELEPKTDFKSLETTNETSENNLNMQNHSITHNQNIKVNPSSQLSENRDEDESKSSENMSVNNPIEKNGDFKVSDEEKEFLLKLRTQMSKSTSMKLLKSDCESNKKNEEVENNNKNVIISTTTTSGSGGVIGDKKGQDSDVNNRNSLLFMDTTRIRLNQSRPSLDQTFPQNPSFSNPENKNSKIRSSSSFRTPGSPLINPHSKLTTSLILNSNSSNLRPKEPPPPPPRRNLNTSLNENLKNSIYSKNNVSIKNKSEISLPLPNLGFSTTNESVKKDESKTLRSPRSKSISEKCAAVEKVLSQNFNFGANEGRALPPVPVSKSEKNSTLTPKKSSEIVEKTQVSSHKESIEVKGRENFNISLKSSPHSEKTAKSPMESIFAEIKNLKSSRDILAQNEISKTSPLELNLDSTGQNIQIFTKENSVSEIRIYSSSSSEASPELNSQSQILSYSPSRSVILINSQNEASFLNNDQNTTPELISSKTDENFQETKTVARNNVPKPPPMPQFHKPYEVSKNINSFKKSIEPEDDEPLYDDVLLKEAQIHNVYYEQLENSQNPDKNGIYSDISSSILNSINNLDELIYDDTQIPQLESSAKNEAKCPLKSENIVENSYRNENLSNDDKNVSKNEKDEPLYDDVSNLKEGILTDSDSGTETDVPPPLPLSGPPIHLGKKSEEFLVIQEKKSSLGSTERYTKNNGGKGGAGSRFLGSLGKKLGAQSSAALRPSGSLRSLNSLNSCHTHAQRKSLISHPFIISTSLENLKDDKKTLLSTPQNLKLSLSQLENYKILPLSSSSESSGVEEDYSSEKNYSLSNSGSEGYNLNKIESETSAKSYSVSNSQSYNAAKNEEDNEELSKLVAETIVLARGKFLESMKLEGANKNEEEDDEPIYEEISEGKEMVRNSSPIYSDAFDANNKSIFDGASRGEILGILELIRERLSSSQIISSSASSERLNLSSCSSNTFRKNAEIERNDSGIGSEASSLVAISQTDTSNNILCTECHEQETDTIRLNHNNETNPKVHSNSLCAACSRRRNERREIIGEIYETEVKYGRDLRILHEEFYSPIQIAGLLSSEQLQAIFLNLDQLREISGELSSRLQGHIERIGEDYERMNVGKIFLEIGEKMMSVFESYCTRQANAGALLTQLEKDKELLRIFLRVSQMENTVLRRMNLPAFLMVPVQRVTRYPLLLSRLLKVTGLDHPSRPELQMAHEQIELHLEHMNKTTHEVGGGSNVKLWRRISIGSPSNPPLSSSISSTSSNRKEIDGGASVRIRKIALDALEWSGLRNVRIIIESQFESILFNNGKIIRGIYGVLLAKGKNLDQDEIQSENIFSLKNKSGEEIHEVKLVLVRNKNSKLTLLREPLCLSNCVINQGYEEFSDFIEINEISSKNTYFLQGLEKFDTLIWYKLLQFYASFVGNWRQRRYGLANIMMNGFKL